jgi:hypothetical protein
MPGKSPYRFSSPLERSDNKLWGAHVVVPASIVERITESHSPRVRCSLNGATEFQCALIPFGSGVRVIAVNKKIRQTLCLEFGQDVEVTVKPDTSPYGLPLPEELKTLFQQDAAGKKVFHSLTPGKQRTLLYIIGSAKTSEKRIARSLTIVQHITRNRGVINYKMLNEELKSHRSSRPRK